MDFIAVDFETPNKKNDAICSMGVTLVQNNQIVWNRNILVNPCTYFDSNNVKIHGISEKTVEEAQTFAEVWEEYRRYFNHYPVVMHNSDFDTSVLYKAAYHAGVVLPDMDFYCTKCLCEENYIIPKYSLETVCQHFNLEHYAHNSGSDSLCTAMIMLKIVENEEASIHVKMSSEVFFEKAAAYKRRMQRETSPKRNVATTISFDANTGSFGINGKPVFTLPKTEESEIVKPDCCYSDEKIEFEGKRFVLTGNFPGMGRSKAIEEIENRGGKVTGSVSKKTDYVIVGEEDKAIVGEDGKSKKIEQAEELIEKGLDIKIIDAVCFVEMIRNK